MNLSMQLEYDELHQMWKEAETSREREALRRAMLLARRVVEEREYRETYINVHRAETNESLARAEKQIPWWKLF